MGENFFDKFPEEIIYNNLNVLKNENKHIRHIIEKHKKKLPAKKEAYKYAYALENTAYELHYQKLVMEKSKLEGIKTSKN